MSSFVKLTGKLLSKLATHVSILAASTEAGHASDGQRGCFSAKSRGQQPNTNKIAVHRTVRHPISPAYSGNGCLLLRLIVPRAGQRIYRRYQRNGNSSSDDQ